METHHRKRAANSSSFFPVDESLLPRLTISPEQHEELRRYALQAALDVVRDGPTWGRSNIKRAVSSGWKVLSARPTACFLVKQRTRSRKSSRAQTRQQSEQLQEDNAKRAMAPARHPPGSSLGSVRGSAIARGQRTLQQPLAPEPLDATSGQHFMAHAVLPNSLEDVMNTLYCEHTQEMRASKQKMYGEAALDCCILQTLERATLEDPFWYLGLKWLALRSPMHALLASREFVYLEHLGTHVDSATGRRVLYRVTQSVHVRGYGGHDSYFGLKRGHIEAAFVYWLDDDNEVRNPLLHVCAKGRLHMKGSMPDALVYKYLKSIWRSERTLFPGNRFSMSSTVLGGEQTPKHKKAKKKKGMARQNKIPNGPPLEMAHEWVADELRPRCSVCDKKFRLISRLKHHCRACGEVICRDCTFRYRVNVRASESSYGVRSTLTPSQDLACDAKAGKEKTSPVNFEKTMTCSFDGRVEDEERLMSEFDASLSIVNARKAVNGPTETAVLGGDTVVCVVMAKVCLSCLHSVPIANGSTQPPRPSEMTCGFGVPTENNANLWRGEEFRQYQSDSKDVQELIGLDDESGQVVEKEQDLPMLIVDDEDTESVDGLAGLSKSLGSYALDARPLEPSMYGRRQSYAEEWIGHEDGELGSHAHCKRVMLLSPHALSTSSSITSFQLNQFMEKDGSSYASSAHSGRYSSQHSGETLSNVEHEDKLSIQFYPTQVDCEERRLDERSSSCSADYDSTRFLDLNSEEREETSASATATERAMRRTRDLQEDSFHQTRRIPSPSMSITSFCSDAEATYNERKESLRDLRQALAQAENSLAIQTRLLFDIKQECNKEAAASAVATVQA